MRKLRTSRLAALLFALLLLLQGGALAVTLEEARALIEEYYIFPVPEAALEETTVAGFIDALGDPYTQYFTAETYAEFLASMDDYDLVGVGVSCTAVEQGLLIQRVFPDSAAETGGLLPGDIVTAIDGRALAGMGVDLAASYLRGEADTEVTITLLRADGTRLTLTLTRTHFTVPATDVELIDDRVALITCDNFGDKTYGQFAYAVASYNWTTDKWIVDLRNNIGGDMQAAADAVSVFTGPGYKSYLQNSAGALEVIGSDVESLTMRPAIVLTGPYTASAAEMFAAAIRNEQAGILIGERTFGKGIGQILFDANYYPELFPDGSALKITAFRFHASNGTTNDQIGLLPNLVVPEGSALPVAFLLSAPTPEADNSGTLRLHIGGWRWYLDLATAVSEDYYPAFCQLLAALSPSTDLYLGTGGQDWVEIPLADLAAQYAPDYLPRLFSDVEGEFATAIHTLSTYGILQGDGTGAFHPGEPLTRAALCALLAQAFGYGLSDAPAPFADVPDDAWYAPYVSTLHRMGIVTGYDDGLFHPDDPINQEQFMTIAARTALALDLRAADAFSNWDTLLPEELEPYAVYDEWARPYVWLLDGMHYRVAAEIDPYDAVLREQAAVSIYTILSVFGILCQ